MRFFWQSTLSVIFGFVGGLIAANTNLLGHHSSAEIRADTIRAARFEVVDSSNRSLAFWGPADQGREIEIAFLDQQPPVRAKFGIRATQVVAGRPAVFTPFNELIGSDGKVRIQQRLDRAQNPVLTMGDSKSENRLLLGHWNDHDVAGTTEEDHFEKWSLVFRDPFYGWRDYVDIGVTTPLGGSERTGYAVFRNSGDRQLSFEPRSK